MDYSWGVHVLSCDDERTVTYKLKSYGVSDGLVNVTDITEDKTGAIWFSTMDGLRKFHHNSWVSYTINDGLKTNELSSVEVDHNNNLWIGSRSALQKFDIAQNQIITTYYGMGTSSVVRPDNTVWIWSDNSRTLSFIKTGNEQFSSIDLGWNNSLSALAVNHDLTVWAAREERVITGPGMTDSYQNHLGIFTYDGEDWVEQKYLGGSISDIFFDTKGNVWVASEGGLWRYDGTEWDLLVKKDALSGAEIIDVDETSEGKIVFITGDLWEYDNGSPLKLLDLPEDLYTLFKDSKGSLWIETAWNSQTSVYKYERTIE